MNDKKQVQPFLQWVGGKRRITNTLTNYIPDGLNNYYEPFLGGGALFYSVRNKFRHCYLSDINLELVTSFNAVKTNWSKVSELYNGHEKEHCKEYYDQVKCTPCCNDPCKIGARFIYLIRYSFRGIYRVNSNGDVLCSCSSRQYKNSLDERLMSASQALDNATISANDFSFIEAKENDFVYFDPPYHKSGEGFYTQKPFNENDQIRLCNFVNTLNDRGVKVMISNSDTNFIRELYKDFTIDEITTTYSIKNHNQQNSELIITNYDRFC